jgi:hypothetical protein
MAFCVNCRPENSTPGNKINVEDTEDEFIIKKPETKDEAYEKFVDELYQHDESKKPKAKRSAEEKVGERLTVETPEEFEIPVKPAHSDENYDKFLAHLYRHDELKRSKRMIVFRHV